VATKLGVFGQILHAALPRVAQIIMNTTFRMFPDSAVAQGQSPERETPSADQIAYTQLLRGIHF
jgi:hypothetical protein